MTEENRSSEQLRLRGDELIAAIHTRQSSTLVIATVASSASLVLLGVYPSSSTNLTVVPVDYWAGFLFPLIGLAYRELTTLSIDAANWRELQGLRGKVTYSRRVRGITVLRKWMLLSFFASPSALWWIRITNYAYTIWVPVTAIALVSALLVALDPQT